MRRLCLCLLFVAVAVLTGPTHNNKTQARDRMGVLERHMQALIEEMRLPGTGDQAELQSGAYAFFDDPDARTLFLDAFASAPLKYRPNLIGLAKLSHRPEFVPALVQEASQHTPRPTTQAMEGATSDIDDASFNAMLSAIALVQNGDSNGLESLIQNADPGIATFVGAQLATHGQLTDAERSTLSSRGRSTNFRALDSETQAQLMTLSPGDLSRLDASKGGPVPTRGAFTSDPSGNAPVANATVTYTGPVLTSCNSDLNTLSADLHDDLVSNAGACDQSFINDSWSRFSMDADKWQTYGYPAPCLTIFPMARTFDALAELAFAGFDDPQCNTNDRNLLHFSYCYAGESIHELVPDCGPSGVPQDARTNFGTFVLDPHTTLSQGFWYRQMVQLRAADIFHEARHAEGWCTHTGNCLAGANACDPSFENGCTGFSSSNGHGAYGYTVLYDWWFADTAQSAMTNSTMQNEAWADANNRLMRNFDQDPCFRIDVTTGGAMNVCP